MTEVASCPHLRCGGCTQLGVPLAAQLTAKKERVRAAFAPYPALASIAIADVARASPIVSYRTRVKWLTGPNAALGLFAKGEDHVVVDVPHCIVASAPIAAVGACLRAILARGEPPWTRSIADGGALFAVDLRDLADGSVLVTLIVDAARVPSPESARALAEELVARSSVTVASVALSLHTAGAPQLLGHETRVVLGEGASWDTPGRARVRVMHGSFVQAHRGQAAAIHDALRAVRDELSARGAVRVLDLYGGSGAIGLALAKEGVAVDLVESFAPAARAAEEAASEVGATLRAIVGDASVIAPRLAQGGERYDLVVANPPRRGLPPDVRRAIARLSPARVAYVSCDPTTLARDLDHLRRLGYAASSVAPFDMIPLTDEVETLAVLARAAIPAADVLHEEADAVFVAKAPHEPTTPQGEHALSLFDRVRALPGFEAAVPVHRLDVGTSGVCLFARTPAAVHGWSQALAAESAEKTYLALVRGISSPKGSITRPLREDGKMITARTRYRRVAVVAGHSLVEARPRDGRTHQIRRHLAGLGHPVLGDERYGHAPSNRYFLARHGLDRTFLHCAKIVLTSPASGKIITISAPLAGDLVATRASAEAPRDAFATGTDLGYRKRFSAPGSPCPTKSARASSSSMTKSSSAISSPTFSAWRAITCAPPRTAPPRSQSSDARTTIW